MTTRTLTTILNIRLLVGFLGERAQNAWWPTSFYEKSSRLFLEPVFSGAFHLAQYHGVLEAARRLHDEHLSVRSFHLFRLREEVEQDLHKMVQSPEVDYPCLQITHTMETAIELLKHLAGGRTANTIGPATVGHIRDLDSADTLEVMAGAYLSAFNQNARTYPYLLGDDVGR